MAMGGPHRVAVDPLGADASALTPLDGVVDAQYRRPGRDKRRDQEAEQQAGRGGSSRTAGRASPEIRSRLVTVRLPGARMAPISRTSACHQLR